MNKYHIAVGGQMRMHNFAFVQTSEMQSVDLMNK